MKHAFPFNGEYYKTPGMTLREYYAGQVLAAIISHPNLAPIANFHDDVIVGRAIILADQLCEALKETKDA